MHKPRRKLLRQLEVVLRISRVAKYLRYIAQELPNIARYARGIACARDSSDRSYSRLTIDPERGADNRFRLRMRRPGLSCRRIGAPHISPQVKYNNTRVGRTPSRGNGSS